MDEIGKELLLLETLTAHGAMNDARVDLEDAAANGRIHGERWEAIRLHVFPLLDAERERLDWELRRLRGES